MILGAAGIRLVIQWRGTVQIQIMERGPKIEHWRGCALGVVFVAFLGGHAHAHAQVATTVKDCEQLQRALGNERVKRIHVRGRIFLGDCVWQEGEMPRR